MMDCLVQARVQWASGVTEQLPIALAPGLSQLRLQLSADRHVASRAPRPASRQFQSVQAASPASSRARGARRTIVTGAACRERVIRCPDGTWRSWSSSKKNLGQPLEFGQGAGSLLPHSAPNSWRQSQASNNFLNLLNQVISIFISHAPNKFGLIRNSKTKHPIEILRIFFR